MLVGSTVNRYDAFGRTEFGFFECWNTNEIEICDGRCILSVAIVARICNAYTHISNSIQNAFMCSHTVVVVFHTQYTQFASTPPHFSFYLQFILNFSESLCHCGFKNSSTMRVPVCVCEGCAGKLHSIKCISKRNRATTATRCK